MLAPAGISSIYEAVIPTKKQHIDIITDITITERNFLHTLIEDNAGKIIRLDISKVPIILIPITIVIAVSTDSIVL